MSYDIELVGADGKVLHVGEHMIRGGTYRIGDTRARLNVTYSYADIFYRVLCPEKGIRVIYGMNALDSVPVLVAAARKLAGDASDDYWQPTEGNARRALLGPASLALLAPHGTWTGD